MKKMFKRVIGMMLIFPILASQAMAISYTPEFSDELSRVGINADPDDANGLDMLSQTGINTIRYALNWHKFEPKKGVWDTDYIDSRITLLENHNFHSMIGVGVNNSLYSENSDIRYGVETRENLEAFSDYCLKLGEYLAENHPQITTFLIWNEPNSISFWKDNPNPASYYNLVKTASIAFKKVIPDCTIIAGVAANPSLNFLNQLYSLGIYKYADIISAQPYVAPSNADEGTLSYRLSQYDKLSSQYGGWKENYISEIGWHTVSDDNTIGVSEETQAENLIKTLALADNYDMSGVNFYELVDGTGNTPASENHYGILEYDYTSKKGYDALVYFQDKIGGADYAGKLTSNDGSSAAYLYHKNGKIIAIAWSQQSSVPLSTLGINRYDSATDIYGEKVSLPFISNSPIYLELSDSSLLCSAIKASINRYYEEIPDICLTDGIISLQNTDILSMDASAIRAHFEQHYVEASSLIDIYSERYEPTDFSLFLTASYKLHKAADKLGILCNYLSEGQSAVSHLTSDEIISYVRNQIEQQAERQVEFYNENTGETSSLDVTFSGIELGDTVTLAIADDTGFPVYVTQKTIGSGVEPSLTCALGALAPGQYSGRISSRISNPVITSISSSNSSLYTDFEDNLFTITIGDSTDIEETEFAHEYPYAQSVLHQAERYNKRAHTLNESIYDSNHKTSYIEIADYIATKLAELSSKVASVEEADFDKGFLIVTTPSFISKSGTVDISAEITNKNALGFDGQVEILDNNNNLLDVIDITIPRKSTESIDFIIEIPEKSDVGQYFYYVNLMVEGKCLSSKAIYIKTQIGPYSSAEIIDENQVASTPSENKFKIGDKEYILLETTDNNESKFFVMEEDVTDTAYFDYKRYDIGFDPSDHDNIAYYLNNSYAVDSAIKKYINKNHSWLTEAGYGDSIRPTDYTVNCGINLMSVQEWYKYAGKFGYVPTNSASNTWWLRTPGTNIDTIRYISTLSGKSLNTYTNQEQRGIRPVYYLNSDFFKKVKPTSIGANVLKAIKQTYSIDELLSGGAYTKEDLIALGIYAKGNAVVAEAKLANTQGDTLVSPENHQDFKVTIVSNSDSPFTAYFAIYSSRNELISCVSANIETETTINVSLPKAAPQGAYAKLFTWQLDTMIPLDVPIIFQSTDN